jgi:hypothetical protein
MPEMKESTHGGGAGDAGSDPEALKRFFLKVVSVTFKSDHALLLDNRSDFQKRGSRHPKPEWVHERRDERVPISHSKHKALELEVEFLSSGDTTESGRLTGKIPTDFVLTSSGSTSFPPGKKVKVKLESAKPIPDSIMKARTNIAWRVNIEGRDYDLTPSGQHLFFITWGDPIDEGNVEDGVTYRRMNTAIDWVGAVWAKGKTDPVEVLDELFGRFEHYVLGFDHLPRALRAYLAVNPGKVKALTEAGFAAYKNDAVGGAWPLSYFEKYSGECQAIVRLIRGLIHQVGMPGKVEVQYVNADARDPYKAIIRSWGTACAGPKPGHKYSLVDARVEKGKRYTAEDSKTKGIGWNNYEAYLKFTYGKEYWYGGGIGRLPEGHDPLKVFYGLVEYKSEFVPGTTQWARHVTDVWVY